MELYYTPTVKELVYSYFKRRLFEINPLYSTKFDAFFGDGYENEDEYNEGLKLYYITEITGREMIDLFMEYESPDLQFPENGSIIIAQTYSAHCSNQHTTWKKMVIVFEMATSVISEAIDLAYTHIELLINNFIDLLKADQSSLDGSFENWIGNKTNLYLLAAVGGSEKLHPGPVQMPPKPNQITVDESPPEKPRATPPMVDQNFRKIIVPSSIENVQSIQRTCTSCNHRTKYPIRLKMIKCGNDVCRRWLCTVFFCNHNCKDLCDMLRHVRVVHEEVVEPGTCVCCGAPKPDPARDFKRCTVCNWLICLEENCNFQTVTFGSMTTHRRTHEYYY